MKIIMLKDIITLNGNLATAFEKRTITHLWEMNHSHEEKILILSS